MSHLTDGISAMSHQPAYDTRVVAAVVAAARVAATISEAFPPGIGAERPSHRNDSAEQTAPAG